MASKDYIKLYRSLLDWEWFTDGNVLRLWIYILLKANWKDGKFKGEEIKRGSFVTSYETMMAETKLTKQEIRTALKKLENTGEISKKITSHQQVITVEKYEFMQEVKQESNISSTSHQHLDNISSTPIEEYKKERSKEGKNKELPTKYINNNMCKPTVEEVQKYIDEKGYHFSAEEFVAYYESNGWRVGRNPMKSWKAATVTWERNFKPKKNTGKSFIGVTDEIERKLGL